MSEPSIEDMVGKSNLKRVLDEFLNESFESMRENRGHVQRTMANSENHSEAIRNISIQSLNNAVETANMIGKQAVAHRDVAIDRTWNLDEVAQLAAKTAVQQDSVQAAALAALLRGMADQLSASDK